MRTVLRFSVVRSESIYHNVMSLCWSSRTLHPSSLTARAMTLRYIKSKLPDSPSSPEPSYNAVFILLTSTWTSRICRKTFRPGDRSYHLKCHCKALLRTRISLRCRSSFYTTSISSCSTLTEQTAHHRLPCLGQQTSLPQTALRWPHKQ